MMVVYQIDSREQCPLVFPPEIETEVVSLPCGDYGIKNFSDWASPHFIIERKSLNDLCGSLTSGRERFLKECEKLRAFRFAAILIEACRSQVEMEHYISTVSPKSILQTLAAIQVRSGIHIIWCGDPAGAAEQFLSLARQFCRGIEKNYDALAKADKA